MNTRECLRTASRLGEEWKPGRLGYANKAERDKKRLISSINPALTIFGEGGATLLGGGGGVLIMSVELGLLIRL